MSDSGKQKAYNVEEIRKVYTKAYAPWAPDEDTLLQKAYKEFNHKRLVSEEVFIQEFAQRLGRNPGAIRSRIAKYRERTELTYQKEKEIISIKVNKKITPSPSSRPLKLDFNPDFQKAYDLMEATQKNIFLTGRAGTGKSTLLAYFRNNTEKKVVVLASTGVAALNVKGQTIHSFFKFKPDITLKGVKRLYKKGESKNIYEKIDTIVIDEISMVRSDLLDCIDKFLQVNRSNSQPFGGVQMIFIGDLYQLPPVVTSSEREIFRSHYQSQYFFDAKVFQQVDFEFIELEKVYRQKDDTFVQLLNAVRNNSATSEHLDQINSRYLPDFVSDTENFSIYLTTTNDLADTINQQELSRLKNKMHTFTGVINGHFERNALPTEIELSVKVGSQIMMLNNDSQGRWVNGTIGKIMEIQKDEDRGDSILVELAEGNVEEVTPYTWELFDFSYDAKSKSLTSETVGTFTQFPLKLAWAVTIHKSQGKTFDNIIIDIGRGTFVHGQLYVALSRCTSLRGIILKQPIQRKHIFMDYRVVRFVTQFQYQKAQDLLPLQEKVQLLEDAAMFGKKVAIVYLKASDEKSKRVIKPFHVGEKQYQGKIFLGVDAFDEKSGEERVFRVDRILSMEIL